MAYLEARARGGLAMVMLGSVGVSFPVGCSNARQTAISDDRHVAPWREAATAGAPPRRRPGDAAHPGRRQQPAGHARRAPDVGGLAPRAPRPRRPLRHGHRRRGREDDGAVHRPRVEAALQGARPRRHRAGGRRLRLRGGARTRGGCRRLRAPRRARLPDRRVPLAGEEPPHRRVRRADREPRAHPGGDPARDPRPGGRRLRGVVPAQLDREPARRHDARRLHRRRPPRRGRGRRCGARLRLPRSRGGHGPDRLVRAARARSPRRQRPRGEGERRRAGDRGRPHRTRPWPKPPSPTARSTSCRWRA